MHLVSALVQSLEKSEKLILSPSPNAFCIDDKKREHYSRKPLKRRKPGFY